MIPPKTAPCLLKELLDYDPRVGADSARLHKGHRCLHEYNVTDRSKLPALDQRPASGDTWSVFSVCQSCYSHYELSVKFPNGELACPTKDYPLHHFVHKTSHHDGEAEDSSNNTLRFECSSAQCVAQLTIRIELAVLTPRDVELLTRKDHLRRRYEHVLEYRGSCEEISAFKALSTLRSYLTNAVNGPEARRIPAANKFFMLALGSDNASLLARLGFVYEPSSDESKEVFWRTPQIVDADSIADGQASRNLLYNVIDELNILLAQRPPAERISGKYESLKPAKREFERVLGTLDYETTRVSRTQTVPDSLQICYGDLGALQDFSDDLIDFAYERQVAMNVEKAPEYFKALREIAAYRKSEFLQMKASTLESEGQLASDAIDDAYRFFNINPTHKQLINDEHIKGCFLSRLQDVSASGRVQAKKALQILARARASPVLEQAVSNELRTYQEALDYLGADHSTPDEWIGTLAATKQEEDPELTQRALDIVSEARQNPSLKFALKWTDEGEARPAMDIQTAYLLLGCEAADDDQAVAEKASIRFSDYDQERKKEVREALGIVANARSSEPLKNYLAENLTIVSKSSAHYPPQEPRGLENIGQTCYLNSLLQYCFTFKQVRDMVLSFEEYRQDADPSVPFARTVGGLSLESSSIRRAQHFVQELRALFQDMITTNKDSITPRDELAGLTLKLEPRVAQKEAEGPGVPGLRRRSTLLDSPKLSRSIAVADYKNQDPAEEPVDVRQEAVPTAAAGAELPSSGDTGSSSPVERPASPMDVENGEQDNQTPQGLDQKDEASTQKSSKLPPLPPRLVAREELAKFAQQHDVGEVLESVLYQLRFAFKPEGVTKDGDQIDTISRLFFGKQAYGRYSQGQRRDITVESFYILFLALPQERNDVYTGLDSYNDTDSEPFLETDFSYMVIHELPPILQFYVQRLGTVGSEVKKNDNLLELDETIFMDRYLANDTMFAKRNQVRKWKAELSDLMPQLTTLRETALGVDMSSVLQLTKEYLSDRRADEFGSNHHETIDELIGATKQAADQIEARIKELEHQISTAFDKTTGQHPYRLHSVFVHRGGAQSGHWFIYIYDAQRKIWRCYNDETITIVNDAKEFLRPDEHGRETSAFVSYVRVDQADQLIETVKREPIVPAPEASEEKPNEEPDNSRMEG